LWVKALDGPTPTTILLFSSYIKIIFFFFFLS
jgi:hypothetical protein